MASEMKEKAVTLTNLGVSNISELFKPFIDPPCSFYELQNFEQWRR